MFNIIEGGEKGDRLYFYVGSLACVYGFKHLNFYIGCEDANRCVKRWRENFNRRREVEGREGWFIKINYF